MTLPVVSSIVTTAFVSGKNEGTQYVPGRPHGKTNELASTRASQTTFEPTWPAWARRDASDAGGLAYGLVAPRAIAFTCAGFSRGCGAEATGPATASADMTSARAGNT